MELRIAGWLNLLIALLHLLGLFWADWMFEVTDIATEMEQLTVLHPVLPYLLTVTVALIFAYFGLYALSGAGRGPRLPFLRPVLLIIAIIYLLRGVGGLIADFITGQLTPLLGLYSLMALVIGLLYWSGWRRLTSKLSKSKPTT